MINKRLLVNYALGVLMAVANGTALAIPIVDVVDPSVLIEVNSTIQTHFYTHNIKDGSAPNKFVPGIDTIDSATIVINLTDNGGNENIEITMDESAPITIGSIGSTGSYTATIPSINDLNEDGMLEILLRTLDTNGAGTFYGNFFFDNSTLTAQVTKGNPVPEPTTLALLSLGLAGLGYARRRKAQKV